MSTSSMCTSALYLSMISIESWPSLRWEAPAAESWTSLLLSWIEMWSRSRSINLTVLQYLSSTRTLKSLDSLESHGWPLKSRRVLTSCRTWSLPTHIFSTWSQSVSSSTRESTENKNQRLRLPWLKKRRKTSSMSKRKKMSKTWKMSWKWRGRSLALQLCTKST